MPNPAGVISGRLLAGFPGADALHVRPFYLLGQAAEMILLAQRENVPFVQS
jgi:hypothetical protein